MSITTNAQSMTAMNLFNELAKLYVRIQPDDKPPHQWIYAVDDAWLHPEDCDVKIALDQSNTNLLPCLPIFESNRSEHPFQPDCIPFITRPDQDDPRFSGYNQGDREVADRLITFVQDKAKEGQRYGLCFCSFEFFWMNIAEIDKPQNAVLFDIRHALGWNESQIMFGANQGDVTQLRDDWKRQIEETQIFDAKLPGVSDAGAIMPRLGWYLHYALKFAKVPGQPGDRCAVGFNHIQIVSSAVNPASGRSDALSDYSEVQKAIWSKLPEDERVTPDLFAFSPMPKDSAMRTGLGVFHNSFKNAANWSWIKKWFLMDIAMVNASYNAPNGHFNNGDVANAADWKWNSWHPSSVKNISDPLYITRNYNPLNPPSPWIKINDLLRMLSHSGVKEFLHSWKSEDYENKEVLLPTTPGCVFVILLIEFINNLGGGQDDRLPPVVSYEFDGDAKNPKFHIKVELKNGGINGLWECYKSGKKQNGELCGTASKALRALGSWYSSEAPNHEIGDKRTIISLLPTDTGIKFQDNYPTIQEPSDNAIIITLNAKEIL